MNREKPRQIAARVLRQRWPGSPQERLTGSSAHPAPTAPATSRANPPFTEVLLERALADAQLSDPDRRLCQELVFGVVRWQGTLDWLIARKTPGRTQKAGLQDLLRLGLYQIFWLDRIPGHAAVHETVEQAKQGGFGPQAGFVNAVLRGYLRELDATRQALADLKAQAPATGWSQPDWLVNRWLARWGAEKTTRLLEWNNSPARTFARLNTLRANAPKLIEKWRAEGVDYDFKTTEWTGENLAFELKSHPPLATLESFQQGWFYIQDPSTLLAPRILDPQPGEKILDLCSAPGGKTTYLAQLVRNEGRILAQDIATERIEMIQENCTRLGVTCVQTVLASANTPPPNLQPASFDKILVDAPCSNTGVMRRRVDLRWRIRVEEIERLRATQLNLLLQAATLLKPGGTLVYSTCSLEPEENQSVVDDFLKQQSQFKLERARELLPFAEGVDGAFIARLRRI